MNPVRNQTPAASADALAHRISNGVKKAAREMDFERAARIRDRIQKYRSAR